MPANNKGFLPEEKGYRFEPLRQFRWELEIGGAESDLTNLKLALITSSKPSVDFDEVAVEHFNDRHYLAGKPKFNSIEWTAYDTQVTQGGKYTSEILEEWRDLVYDPRTNIMLPKEGGGDSGYAREAVLTMMDGSGNDLQQWKMLGAWPQSIKFGDLDYKSSETCIISCTMRIDKAFIIK